MASIEQQPLKKRKIFDSFLSDSSQSETLAHGPPQTPPPTPNPKDDLAKKRRNRDEVKTLHDVYRRIKYCVDHKDALPQLQQAYLSLIAASKGCVSAQRIAADLIPRYAQYCSASIEAAVEALISMYGSSMDVIDKKEDDSGIAFDIAVACVVGLADICCIAPSQAMNGIRASVFWTVLVFFLSSFGKQDLHQFIDSFTVEMMQSSKHFQELKHQTLDDSNKDISQKLMMLRCLSLFRIFACRPKDSLSACFDFIHLDEKERPHDKGLYFLRQVTTRSNENVSNRKENASDDTELCSGSSQIPASSNGPNGIETNTGNNDDNGCEIRHAIESSLLEKVLAKDHSLRKWLTSKYNMLGGSVQSEEVSVITSAFERLLQSNGEAYTQEEGLDKCEEDNSAASSSSRFNSRNRGDLSSDVLDDQLLSPRTKNASGLPPEIPSVGNLNVLNDNYEVSNKGFSTTGSGPSVGLNNALTSPASGHESGNQIELFDGDSEAMDVFSASKLLWVGSLTADASEGYLRFQFERLGPIDLVRVCTVNSYAIVGFKYIMDAIKARDYMRIHTPWDIRFSNGMGISPNNNVPVGPSSYAYIGNITSQWAKDEILYECRKVIHNGPCMITDLTREGALLLEFETPAEAAKVMTHLRRHRREKIPPPSSGIISNARAQLDSGRTLHGSGPGAIGNSVSGNLSKSKAESLHSHPLPLPQQHQHSIPQSPADRIGVTAQSLPGNNSVASFISKSEGGHLELVSPRLQPDNLRTLPQGGHAVHSQWPASEADRTLSAGYTEQMWMHTTPVNLSGVSAQGHVPQSQHFQAGQYMHPVFAPSSSSWDPRGGNQSMNVNPLPSGIMHNNSQGYHSVSTFHVGPPPLQDIPQPHPGMPPLPLCSPLPDYPHPPPPLPLSSPKPQPQASSNSHLSGTRNASPSEYHWQGTLSKSGVRFCTIQAKRTESEICKYTNVSSEPSEWPSKFDMTKRTDFQHVKSTFKSTPPHKREVCRLIPSSSADHKGFQDFISYLKQRNCVGVIKVPAGKSMWARLIFLIPYSLDVCTFLSISPSPSDCLIALVLPKEPCIDGS